MDARLHRLVELAGEHYPCSVRHLYYRAVVDKMPGITKDNRGYGKVQRAVLGLRREGRIPYAWITDNSRSGFIVDSHDGPEDFLTDVAGLYRRDLWRHTPFRVEVWCESDSIAGTLMDITSKWRVPLYPIKGQSSETFVYNGVQQWRHRPEARPVVLYVGDHDPAGLEIEATLQTKLTDFAAAAGLDAPDFHRIGVTWQQAVDQDLPGTTPKKAYGYPLAVEAEALQPRYLRQLLDDAIGLYVDPDQLQHLLTIEAEERDGLRRLAEAYGHTA
ncbi:hypothetical protein BH23ACT9_BH23ACT9_34160 [soil metagenome]